MTSKLNWFSSAPVGTWTTKVSNEEASWLSIIFLGTLVLLIWGATVPELFVMSMFYLVMLGASFGAIVLNYFVPQNPFFSTLSAGNGEKIARGFLLGIIICVIVIIFQGLISGRTGFFFESYIVDVKTIGLILVIITIPFIEEVFCGAFLTPTLAEKGGIIFSLVGNILIFMTLHWVIFNASPNLLFVSMCFRGLSSGVQLYEKSWTAGYFAHLFFNLSQSGLLFSLLMGV